VAAALFTRIASWQFAAGGFLGLLGGCVTQAPLGDALAVATDAAGYRFRHAIPERRTNDLLVVMTFSGGGNRASALAYGVLEQLAADQIEQDGSRKPLLDEVDVISAVWGGSVVAAYFALHGDLIFSKFRPAFLDRAVAGELWRSMLLSPRNWRKLGSGQFARGDLFAEYLDRHLFDGGIFADLQSLPNRPFIVINATDLSASGRFEFTQEWFDMICVDLGKYSIARAVAASSAYPVLITPIAIENRAGTCQYSPPPRLRELVDAGVRSREAHLATRLLSYQDPSRIRYLHLADGSMADVLGIRTVIDVLTGAKDVKGVKDTQAQLGLNDIRRVVVITVNAAGRASDAAALRRAPPGIVEMATLSSSALIEESANENRILLREQLARIARPLQVADKSAAQIDTYWIDVELAALVAAGFCRLSPSA
jgi:NTE family protein